MIYEATTQSGDAAPQTFLFETEVLSVEGETIVIAECTEWNCTASAYRKFGQTLIEAEFQGRPEVGLTLSDVEEITGVGLITHNYNLDPPFFPLEEGKTITWTEDWSSSNYPITYQTIMRQSCCQQMTVGARAGRDLWELSYVFKELDVPGGTRGVGTYLIDPKLGWYVSYEMVFQYPSGDEIVTDLYSMILTEVRLPN